MNSLLLVTIGPVQDFIVSARRTRDLAFGSWFLSELARAAAHKILAHDGFLIFPAPLSADMLEPNATDFPVPNKIIARIQEPPHEVSERVHKAVLSRLHTIRDNAFHGGISAAGKRTYQAIPFAPEQRKIAHAQVEDLVEFLWAALPFPDDADYQQTRKDLEALMAARKNTRNFTAVSWQSEVPKSSLSGQLESVIPEKNFPDFRVAPAENRIRIQNLYDQYGAGPAELSQASIS